jgi:pimeloyl-ACP methyl ester carboxylesterase
MAMMGGEFGEMSVVNRKTSGRKPTESGRAFRARRVKGSPLEVFHFHGLPIKYSRVGQGDPVVMLHNGGASHAIWDEVSDRLAGEYELFALDLLGYGESAKPGHGYTLDNYVVMLEEFVDSRGLSGIRLVGNCMGCAISLTYTDRHTESVKALVLCNPLTEATFLGGWLGPFLWMREHFPSLSRRFYRVLGRIRFTNWIGSLVTLFQLGPLGRARKVHRNPDLCACYANSGQMKSLLGVLDDLANYSVVDRLVPREGFPPICTVWGLENRVLSPKAGCRLNASLRPVRQEWLPGCGHLPMLEQPDEVATIIDEFFKAAAAARRD